MEQKTDLSREFGLLPDRKRQEFGSDPAAMDPKTDLTPEFTHPPDSEFGDAQKHREFAHSSDSEDPVKKMTRRERHRRTLLLQMAAVGLSAVVVTSSFGQDILGDDMLFTDTDHDSSGSYSSQIVIEKIDEASKHDDDDVLYHTAYLIYRDGTSDPGPYSDSVRYDERSNTLYLDTCQVDVLRIDNMGDDFTIYVENTSYVGLIECVGGNLTISGRAGTDLRINQHDEYVTWWHGIVLYGIGTDAALTITPGITVDIYGDSGAIAIDNTTAPVGIDFDHAYTTLSGIVQSGSYLFHDGIFVDYGGAPDWTVLDEQGTPAAHVTFSSNGYNPDYDTPVSPNPGETTPPATPVGPDLSGLSEIPRLTITDTNGTLYVIWENGSFRSAVSSYQHLASYDPGANILTIGSAPLNTIEANAMGTDFTIHVAQDVSVGTICSTAYLDDGTITITGENTMLTVNDAMTYEYGIYIDAAGGMSYLQIEPGVTISALGFEAGLAIANSWADPGLVYDSTLTYVYEPVMTGDYWFPSNGSDSGSTQDTTVIDEKDPFQAPSTHVYIEGSYIEPEPEPPTEELLLNQYSDLYVTFPGNTTPIYLVENGQLTGNGQQIDGLSYDISTNTLTLSDFAGDIISANVMGDEFTIYLQGKNQVGMISSGGSNNIASGSVTITGECGAVLILNEDSTQMYGITLSADNTDTRLTIDSGINVTAHGSYYAIQVTTTTAENAISIHDSLAVTGGTVSVSASQGALEPESQNWLFRTEDGQLSKTVSFQSVQRAGVFVTLTPGNEPINVYGQGQLDVGADSMAGLVCDADSSTLFLTGFTADRIEIYGMDAFDLHLTGDNHIGQIYSDSSLNFKGDAYATLTVNEELLYANGLVIKAGGSARALSAQWGPDIQVYGRDSAAIAVYDSTALNGISLGTEMLLSGYVTQGSLAGDSFDHTSGVRSWTVYDTYGTVLPSRHVTISSNHKGGPSDDGRLTISVGDISTVLFTDRHPTAEASSLPGISYDHATNTLTLIGAAFDHIEAYHMGSEFTIDLSGENYGQSIISVGSPNSADGSLRISGDHFGDTALYGGLYLTSDVNPYGILLEANGGSSVLEIDWVDTLAVTAPDTAVMVHDSTASSGIVVDEYMMEGQVTQQTSDAGTECFITDRITGERLSSVSMHGGYGGGFYDVEHNGIIAFEPPSSDAQRWIYVDTFSPIYVDDPTYDYVEAFEGVTYDEASNTLTLNNCDVVSIETVLMGDDFTIHLMGDNYVDELIVNAGNVTFTGTGSLTIYAAHSGLRLEAQNRPHFIRIEHGVTMELVSSYSAIRIHASTAAQPFILAEGVTISGTLAVGFHNDSCYGVIPDCSAGAANYSFINSKRQSDEFTEYVHGTDLRILSN